MSIFLSGRTCWPDTRQQDGADNMNSAENVTMALFNHLGKTFEQDFDL
jgi:hypothetical protein